MDLILLAAHCAEERQNYHQTGTCDETPCLDLWRQALYEKRNEAWDKVIECFALDVRRWFSKHGYKHRVLTYGPEDHFVSAAFMKLKEKNERDPIEVRSLPAILTYLRGSLNFVVLEVKRLLDHQPQTVLLDPTLRDRRDIEHDVEVKDRARQAWTCLLECAADDRERRLLWLRYPQGYKPEEIVNQFHAEYPDINEVRRILARVIIKFRRRWSEQETP